MNIFLVEDDPVLGSSIKDALGYEGFQVQWAKNFKEAIQFIHHADKVQCFILDIGLPDGDGISLCKKVREENQKIPIIFLTAQTDEETLLNAFQAGANDFVKKPFSQKELFARIKAHTKEVKGSQSQVVFRDLKIDLSNREVFYREQKLEFNNTEIQLLYLMAMNAEKVLTRDRLMEFLGKENEIFDRTIDSHISHIRKQFKNHKSIPLQIKSVYGVGYKLEVDGDNE